MALQGTVGGRLSLQDLGFFPLSLWRNEFAGLANPDIDGFATLLY